MWTLFLVFVGCSANQDSAFSAVQPGLGPNSYQLIVSPGRTENSDGSVRAYPLQLNNPQLDRNIVIDFRQPIAVQGTVSGLNATPRARARLPGSIGPIDATVAFRSDTALTDQLVSTDEDGVFQAWLTPGSHEVVVRPDNGLTPPAQFSIDIDTQAIAPLEIDLREHVPVWGRVTKEGLGKRDASVRLIFLDGSAGPVVRTDSDGWYELRASEGLAAGIETLGSGSGIDPILSKPVQAIPPQGRRADFEYHDSDVQTVAARILNSNGVGRSGAPYQVRSLELYDDPEGHVEITGFTDTAGNLTTRVFPGFYEVIVLMDQGSKHTSVRRVIDVSADVDLGVLELESLVVMRGTVEDNGGVPVPDSVVSCTELDFAQRTWATTTESDGSYTLQVAATLVSCLASPGHRLDLAPTRVEVDPTQGPDLDLVLGTGDRVEGVVTYESSPENYALIEVLGPGGLVWGTAVTGETGRFSMRLAPTLTR